MVIAQGLHYYSPILIGFFGFTKIRQNFYELANVNVPQKNSYRTKKEYAKQTFPQHIHQPAVFITT
jgi:hypothetical protein